MLKRVIVFIVFCTSFLFAEMSQSAIIAAVKANPSLLNTPQAQAEMAKYGVSKSDVLAKINGAGNTATATQTSQNTQPFNNIVTSQMTNPYYPMRNDQSETNTTSENNTTSVYVDPFAYTQNATLLQELRAKQLIKQSPPLQRYGISFFNNRNDVNTTALPVPNYYVLSYGDTLSLWIYGTTNENFTLQVNNNGDIDIPQYGPLHVAGIAFGKLQSYLENKLQKVYPNTKLVANIANYSTIQVNLVGAVVSPGVYNVNALSSVKNLLIEAQGIKPNGSLRNVLVKRNGKVIADIDFYKLLQDGDNGTSVVLQPNDTVFIPKAKKLVSIYGQVNDPAIFELKPKETLITLLNYAGGLKADSSKYGFIVERYVDHQKLQTINVNLNEAKTFQLSNGDKVYVYAISKTNKNSISIYGNVVRPGSVAINQYKTLGNLLHHEISKQTLQGVFLKHTLFSYALVKSITPSLGVQVKSFNLSDVLNKKTDITLHPGDKFYIFNKYNSSVIPYVTINNEVLDTNDSNTISSAPDSSNSTTDANGTVSVVIQHGKRLYYKSATISGNAKPVIAKPGKYRYYHDMTVRDLLNMAGKTSRYNKLDEVSITTYNTKNFMPETIMLQGTKALDYKLSAFDKVIVYDYYKFHPVKSFIIYGQVNVPESYPLTQGMTLQNAINTAGGFTQKAYTQDIEVVRHYIKNNERKIRIIKVAKKDFKTFVLQDFDDIHVHIIPNWGDTQTITIKGQVNFPGTYVIQPGERLASLIQRAGGFTQNAFLNGAIFTRKSIKKLQEQRLKQSLMQLKQKIVSLSASPRSFGETASNVDLVALSNMIDKLSKEAQTLGPIGRISINLQRNLAQFAMSKSNIVLKDNDTLTIPSQNNTVLIVGQVMSPTAIVYASNDANYYIKQAGGLTQTADSDHMYVIHANGSAQKIDTGWFGDEHIVRAGDTIIVPQELVTYSGLQMTKDIASILYQFALTTASLHVVGAI